MKQNTPPKFETPPLSDEAERNMIMSFVECENLTERDLQCPNCKAPIAGIFSDATGHLRVKCQKCKANMVLSLEYFRTMKGYSEYKARILSKQND